MEYRRALAILEERRESRVRLGLGRIRRHLRALGDPQEAYGSVHVAGTNGKGSFCAMLASVLREAGYRTGLYTSPHLLEPRERIRVDGRMIPRAEFGRLMGRTLSREGGGRLTYFELLTSIAFQHFRKAGVEAAVLETGLGGRCDATNAVRRPLLAVVTTIDYDHMDFLGRSLASIAREKAGIFKAGPALCGERKPAALAVLRSAARKVGARLRALPARPALRLLRTDWRRGRQVLAAESGRRLELGLLGLSQARNAALVLEAVRELRGRGLRIPDAAVARGLAGVRWPGRFELLRRGSRTLILDGAHNVQAMRHFRATLEASPWRRSPKLFILGFLRDKRHLEMVRLLAPHLREAIAVRPESPRALDPAELAVEIKAEAPAARVTALSEPGEALAAWLSGSGPAVACVCGSFYLAGAARRLMGGPSW